MGGSIYGWGAIATLSLMSKWHKNKYPNKSKEGIKMIYRILIEESKFDIKKLEFILERLIEIESFEETPNHTYKIIL